MRPLHECRGKLFQILTKRSSLMPFNEAPARMQGKTSMLPANELRTFSLQ